MDNLPQILPIMILILGIVIVWLDYQKKARIFELHHKERLLAIERGMEVPPLPSEFFMTRKQSPSPSSADSNLRWGLIWLLVGLAVATALLVTGAAERAVWALVPMAIGLAQLIFYRLSGQQLNRARNAVPIADSPPSDGAAGSESINKTGL